MALSVGQNILNHKATIKTNNLFVALYTRLNNKIISVYCYYSVFDIFRPFLVYAFSFLIITKKKKKNLEMTALITAERPFGIYLYPYFESFYKLVIGKRASSFRFESGKTPLSANKEGKQDKMYIYIQLICKQ